jgi:DNA-binding NtrC family response regulator
MINIGLYSSDEALFPLLSSALGRDFGFLLKSEVQGTDILSQDEQSDVILVDLNAKNDRLQQAIEFTQRLIASGIPVVIMVGDAHRSIAFDLVRKGAFASCRRPPSIRELKVMLTRASEHSSVGRSRQTGHLAGSSASCDLMIGSSPQMQKVYKRVRQVTSLSASVLVTGESGTGKELIARAIHNLGVRSCRPFVAVSCGAIPETLLEAELFGHEKGAFTGTVGAREGYFEQAGDGTLFLDEIGDLSLYTQVKLLRVLQEMEFSRLGSNRLIPLRARLIFATHRDLSKMVAAGQFRQDLFYRINVMQIVSPQLQEHPEDIPQIARHFMERYAREFHKPLRDIEPDAISALQNYPWPGNVRELENVMQRATILATGETVRREDLALDNQEDDAADSDLDLARVSNLVDIAEYQPGGSFEQQLCAYKIKLAVMAVRENNGNRTLAARRLGISRVYLHRLIRLADPKDVQQPDSGQKMVALS